MTVEPHAVKRERKTMQDTESVTTPPAGLKQLSGPSSRRGKIDAGTGVISWDIAVLPGDGIGPEVIGAALAVLKALERKWTKVRFAFHEQAVGAAEYIRHGDPLPEEAFAACREADAVLLGAMGLPSVRWPDGRELTPQIDLRERLDLYAGLRPIRLYHAQDTPLKRYGAGEIDMVIVRENCEGLFSARLIKSDPAGDEGRDVMRITRRGAERICRAAFELARRRRKRCTLVDKANVLPSMVFFRSVFDECRPGIPRGRGLTRLCGCDGLVPAAETPRIRCAGHGKHVWRYPQRPGRRSRRRHGHGAVGGHRR